MAIGARSLALLLLVSCGSPDSNERYFFAIRWAFADGRTCADAGVSALRFETADTMLVRATMTDCEGGRVGNPSSMPQTVGQIPAGDHDYILEALTPSGGVLYRARFSVDPMQHPELDLTLDFVGGT
jgi:hypothetical protein